MLHFLTSGRLEDERKKPLLKDNNSNQNQNKSDNDPKKKKKKRKTRNLFSGFDHKYLKPFFCIDPSSTEHNTKTFYLVMAESLTKSSLSSTEIKNKNVKDYFTSILKDSDTKVQTSLAHQKEIYGDLNSAYNTVDGSNTVKGPIQLTHQEFPSSHSYDSSRDVTVTVREVSAEKKLAEKDKQPMKVKSRNTNSMKNSEDQKVCAFLSPGLVFPLLIFLVRTDHAISASKRLHAFVPFS
jgi:hypothetical protein